MYVNIFLFIIVLIQFDTEDAFGMLYFHIPGFTFSGNSEYAVVHGYDHNSIICSAPQPVVEMELDSGPGEPYDQIYVFQIEASNVLEHSKMPADMISNDVDFTNYNTVYNNFKDRMRVIQH